MLPYLNKELFFLSFLSTGKSQGLILWGGGGWDKIHPSPTYFVHIHVPSILKSCPRHNVFVFSWIFKDSEDLKGSRIVTSQLFLSLSILLARVGARVLRKWLGGYLEPQAEGSVISLIILLPIYFLKWHWKFYL